MKTQRNQWKPRGQWQRNGDRYILTYDAKLETVKAGWNVEIQVPRRGSGSGFTPIVCEPYAPQSAVHFGEPAKTLATAQKRALAILRDAGGYKGE